MSPEAGSPGAEQSPGAESPGAESPGAGSPDGVELGTRILGGVWAVVWAVAGVLLARRVFQLDFGAENPRVLTVIRAASVVVPAYPALLGLYVALTGRRPPVRFDPLRLPFQPWWYETLGALTWREVRRVFFHPVAYVVLFVFLLMNGFLFTLLLGAYAGPLSFGRDFELPASHFVTENGWLWMSLVLICPALTMRLLAEEQREGTLEMLLTAPVTDIQVVLSKFLGTLTYYLFMTSLTLAYLAILRQYAPEWDWGPVLGGYLGLVLGGALFLSIGVFTSSVTQSQIIAYLLAALPLVGVVLVVPQFQGAEMLPAWGQAALRHVNVMQHQFEMATGVVQWKSLVFYVSSTVFFLFLAVRGVESRRWR